MVTVSASGAVLGLSKVGETDHIHLLCKGKHQCMADLLFYWFGNHQTSKSVFNFNVRKATESQNCQIGGQPFSDTYIAL